MSRLTPRAPRGGAPPAARRIVERLARSERVEVSATANDDEIEALRAIVEGTARNTGEVFFQSLVRHLATTVGVSYAFVAEFADVPTRVRTLAHWGRGQIIDNVEYELAGTPCEDVVKGGLCHHPRGVRERFPDDQYLVDFGIESYLGVPLPDGDGRALGHLAIYDERPMPSEPRRLFIFRIFAARAAAELERLRVEKQLVESERRYRGLYEEAVRAEAETARLNQQNLYLQEEIKSVHNFEEIIGRSPALMAALDKVGRVAPTDATVLISGETGTDKELIARAIHSHSRRAAKPLIKVNCASLPAGLVESELFGHEKGAFTGAIARRIGRFELADGGTLFLDEIGELPAPAQAKLLRILQEHELERVGGGKPIKVDARIVAATNRDLQKAVYEKSFREDLYYRLNVFPITLPALRDRAEDIPLLARYLVEKYASRVGNRIVAVSPATMRRVVAYRWPGNIRELQNVLERAVILATGPTLELDIDAELPIGPAAPADDASTGSLEAVERRHILTVLKQAHWVIDGSRGAAAILGLHPNTLRSRLKKLGISRSSHEPS